MNRITAKIENGQVGIRIDKILTDLYKNLPRTKIQELLDGGNLKKNGVIFRDVSYKAKLGDEFILEIPEFQEKTLKPTAIPLDIVYEDDDLIVLNKQVGLTTHPGAGNDENTLANALLSIYGDKLSKIGGDFRPGIVHRLDKETSGLMVVAKNDEAHLNLSQQLQDRNLKRTYVGFIWGTMSPRTGQIEGYMERSKTNRAKMEMVDPDGEGRYSLTNYKTKETFADGSLSMVEFNLDTGRTHQIRVHCSSRGHPLVGDQVYGGRSRHMKSIYPIKDAVDIFPRQALHSYKIQFSQPTTGEKLKFEVGLPEDMEKLYGQIKKLRDKSNK